MTTPMHHLQDYWEETLESDLRGFADPHTDPTVVASGSEVVAEWTQRGRDQTAEFRLTQDADFRWVPSPGAEPLTYRQFMSSEGMADFGQLAKAIGHTFRRPVSYVETKAIPEGNGESEDTSSDVLLFERSSDALQEVPGTTQLLFLKGDAGSGKTTLLRELTRRQADRFLHGESPFLYLYVSAQGRALSNLRDAFSGELDDLRAGFTRDAVPPLVRQGLVVPIIDGFDELLGAAGYGDAFGSLHQLLEQLSGLGALIVSARSSFYDVEFLGRELTSPSRSSAYDVVPIALRPWGESEVFTYLAQVRGLDSVRANDRDAIAALPEPDRGLLGKPFFASRFPDYMDSPDGSDRGVSLSEYLVESYVRRESEKIVDRDGQPLLDAEGHRQIFLWTAEFMWNGERRDFSADDLRAVAELVAEDVGLTGDSAKQVVTKITSYAGFRTSREGREQRFQFEHEVYFDHFLSEALRRRVDTPTDLASFLDGGLLPEEVISAVVDTTNASRWLDALEGFRRTGVLEENRRRNAGTLAAACFRAMSVVKDRVVSSCEFVNTSFGDGAFEGTRFVDCRFAGVGLEGARFVGCIASDCVAESLVICPGGELGISGLVPGENLCCVIDVTSGKEIFSPTEMKKTLDLAGMPNMQEAADTVWCSPEGEGMIDLLQKVAKKYRQSNLLCLEDNSLARLFQDRHWLAVRGLLVKHGIVTEETRQTSGSNKTFLRCAVSFPELMGLEREKTLPSGGMGDFWRELRDFR